MDKIIVENAYVLNQLLGNYGIGEKIRSQFVGDCLLALKRNIPYMHLSAREICMNIRGLLKNISEKDALFKILNVINTQDISALNTEQFRHILKEIREKILPFTGDKEGYDLLNLFFTNFNKYAGKSDKNQAFTPAHIARFMCKVLGVNRNTVVLDPCCGSGVFMVQAMAEMLADCSSEAEKERVRQKQIYGIECEEAAFGLAATNILIHGGAVENVVLGSCFEAENFADIGVNTVLMNPPYNAHRKFCYEKYANKWGAKTKEDPSKGFHFVYEIAEKVKTGKLAVLLPMQCAIGSDSEIKAYKAKMLEKHTLDAVFSFPADMFHPGANVNACCMVFTLGKKHENATFFGYFRDDGFTKKKNLGRIEQNNTWAEIEENWLNLYRNRKTQVGISVCREVTAEDEWLAEAYMATDYSKLTQEDFENTVRNYLAYLLKSGDFYEN